MRIKPIKEFKRALTPPPDKSITIRALILGWLADGKTTISNPLIAGDTVAAIEAIGDMGAEISAEGGKITVSGGKYVSAQVDAKNSATVMRLLAGAVAGLPHLNVNIRGDKSLSRRNMGSLVSALQSMGAEITCSGDFPPLKICGKKLHGVDFSPSTPSAQIKSAVLLAGLNADGETTIFEKIPTRTHTEDMLAKFGADITRENGLIKLRPSRLTGTDIDVPGDISSAAYPMALALSRGFCYLKNVGSARHELIDFLKSIGGDIECDYRGDRADITVRMSQIKPFELKGATATALIDELPLIAVLGCLTGGECVISDAAALRNKECDRIKATVGGLRALGADITELKDGFVIAGTGIKGGDAITCGDHRIAMSMAVANALSEKGGTVDDEKCVEISYPSFWELLI